MLKSTVQDEEPDVDEEEQNEFSELRNSEIERESCGNPEESSKNYEMLGNSDDKMTLHKSLLLELGTRFHNNKNESEQMQEGKPEDDEQHSNLELNNNGEGKTEVTHREIESPPGSVSQYAQSCDGRINDDNDYHDWEKIGSEELMRMTRWSSLKKKVKDKLSRNSYTGCYTIAHNKPNDGNPSQKYSPYSLHDLPNQVPNSQWYTNEVAVTENEQQEASETTHPKHEQICAIGASDSKHNPGAVYNFSIFFEPRKYSETSGFSDCFISDPLKVFDSQICLKIRLNKRLEGQGYVSVQMCSDFDLACYLHRRTLLVGLPSMSPITFVDEPPFGEDLGQKWAEEVYWRSKDIPHKLIERQEHLPGVTIRIHLIIEPLSPLIRSWESNDGVLIWKIRNYRQNLQDEKDGVKECLLSPYFYSHQRGYRLRARLFLNGAGPAVGTYMSVFLDFLVGQWDEYLPASLTQFPHRATFTVLDQSENDRKLDLSRAEVNTRGFGSGDFFYDFVPLAALQEDLHFRRDTLVLRITVKPIDLARDSTWNAPFVAPPKPPVPSRPSKK